MSAVSPSQLSYDVFVSDGPTGVGDELMPDGAPLTWSPLSSTLVFGGRDALLVDPPFTRTQIQAVGDWIERSGKRLAYIYATHGHGDHWFGTGELARRFPGVAVYATEGTIEVMRQQGGPSREQRRRLQRRHQYISEGGGSGLEEWLRALDRVAALHPRAVVAGHKDKKRPDDPAVLDETRRYLQDVIRLLDDKPTARDFYDQLIALYPGRLNPGIVWLGARGLLG
jgi:metallo-beta-lactamase superfamily protein